MYTINDHFYLTYIYTNIHLYVYSQYTIQSLVESLQCVLYCWEMIKIPQGQLEQQTDLVGQWSIGPGSTM